MNEVWIQRDAGGVIVGLFANRQPGMAEERSTEFDMEVVAFRAHLADLLAANSAS